MDTHIPNPIRVHEKLAILIKERFGVFLEIEHVRFNNLQTAQSRGFPQAITYVTAYRSLSDARNGANPISTGRAECGWGDRFERRKGLTIALRRLYRYLANMKANNLI